MREVQLLLGGAVAAVPFAVFGWLEAWQIGACATLVIGLYGVCGWLALRARRSWQAEVAADRRRKRANVQLSASWPKNVRVISDDRMPKGVVALVLDDELKARP